MGNAQINPRLTTRLLGSIRMVNSFPSIRNKYQVHSVWGWLRHIVRLVGWLGVYITSCLSVQGQSVSALATHFLDRLGEMALPIRSFDYQQELKQIPSLAKLEQKQALINSVQQRLNQLDTVALTVADHLLYDQLRYELSQHQRQLQLEQGFRQRPPTAISAQGLSGLANGPAWYAHYVRRYTNTELTPEELFAFGQQRVDQAQRAIDSLQVRMGYGTDANAFQRHLKDTSFFMADTGRILRQYRRLEQRVRGRLGRLFIDTIVGPLHIQAWRGATPAMPPAIYLPERHAFAINLATGRYNRRIMDWVLLHEGLPGHHYQASLHGATPNPFQASYYYLGNLEGWGCYAESLGSQLGLYQTAEQELGRWEWDLVRSVRVVLDVGIHVRGWTFGQALAYWQATIQGQDELAEREIRRVTQWPGQCLSYKVGAWRIEQMKRGLSRQGVFDLRRFHQAYLRLSSVPLNLVGKYLPFLYNRSGGGASPR